MPSNRPRAFNYAVEYICDFCSCSNGECEPGDTSCPFWSDFCELQKLFDTADELADSLEKKARENDRAMLYREACMDWGY
ncbi:MAG: hypothetical protein IJP54_09065 [Synergistaceae bacterium]|nr:hypothetical protein [Synergistaceae bacterium]